MPPAEPGPHLRIDALRLDTERADIDQRALNLHTTLTEQHPQQTLGDIGHQAIDGQPLAGERLRR